MAARQYSLQPASIPSPEEFGFRGIKVDDTLDTAQAGSFQNHLNAISARSTIKIPQNTPFAQQTALTELFGAYQLQPTASSSTHPTTDAFRRICDNYVGDRFGAQNIVEVGPSLSKLATRPNLFPGHSCSPTLDGRDRARALQSRFKIAPNHPHANTLVARSNGQYPNPVAMCNLEAHACQEQLPVLYASYSLQDRTPSYLVECMRSHGAHTALVALSLPIPLRYVSSYHDADTGVRWSRRDAVPATLTRPRQPATAICHQGTGAAGYTHSLDSLNAWLDGFEGVPLFGEVLFQYGSSVLFIFSLNDTPESSAPYPLLISTTLSRYSLIPANLGSEADFLTSSSHYQRLVAYLTIHHHKFSANLFKAALERISVLTPAIILGSTKHTARWMLEADERTDVAIAACHDVQKALHTAELAHGLVEVHNTQLATTARETKRALAPGIAARFVAALRGEKTLELDLGVLDRIATALDGGRSAYDIHVLGGLPPTLEINNGGPGEREPAPAPLAPAPPPPPAPPAAQPYQPGRNGFPAPQPWHLVHDQVWANQQNVLPAARGARLLQATDPVANHLAAERGHQARPIDGLSNLHRQALDNAGWSVDTAINTLCIGPPGSGKTTFANRVAPAGSMVIVPTDDLATQWQARRPTATVLTLDAAMCQPRLLRTAPAIIIDEVFKFPAVYVHSFCDLGVPVIALGDLGQATYGGHLGPAFALDNTPIDHIVVFNQILRGGADTTTLMNDRLAHHYRREFNLPANWQFVTPNVGVNNFQRVIVDRNGHHLTCQRANTNIIAGCSTIGSSQGAEWRDVYVHLFDGDEAYFRRVPGDLIVAVTRGTNTTTVTVPARGAQGLRMYLNGLRIPFVPRPANGSVYGSAHPVLDLPTLERQMPGAFYFEEELPQRELYSSGRESRGLDVHAVLVPELPINIAVVLEHAATAPPNPADLSNQELDVKFRRPDAHIRVAVDEWEPAQPFQEPTVLPHIGYPFTNTEQLASIYAIFDRYTKPQNVKISNVDAAGLADFMFDSWVDAFIDPRAVVTLPSTNDLLAHWLSKRTANELVAIDQSALRADTAGLFLSTYFLKAQAKPKFGTYGHMLECGQGIIAMEKLINASECPLLVGAVKTMQAMFKGNVLYDSGYSVLELDDAVAACLQGTNPSCLSIDLSQQDSSHMLVHRLFIAKVLRFLGFGDMVCSAYLLSREFRTVKGMSLNVLFQVIERLFSGEPGTAFFNFLMSTGTTASTFDLRNFTLFVGKGDDNTVVPAPHRRSTAAQVIRKTGVIQKTERLPYLDFANRIWASTGRSFCDPLRLLSKFTCRLTSRENTENEFQAWVDYDFTPSELEAEDVAHALCLKHKIEYCDAYDIVTAAHSLSNRANYMSLLRPGKVPATELPVISHCCGHEIVFEDTRDRCGVEALAFLADVPVDTVVGHLQALRMSRPAPDALAADRLSPHHSAIHIEHHEVYALLRLLQISAARGRDGLRIHACRNHISVVRVNHQRSAIRSACRVFGSVTSATLALLLTLLRFALHTIPVLVLRCLRRLASVFWLPMLVLMLLVCLCVSWYRMMPRQLARLSDRVRGLRMLPQPVSLRHQPLVYGSRENRTEALAVLGSWAAYILLTAGLVYIAVTQSAFTYALLYDASFLLIEEVPLLNFSLMFLRLFTVDYLAVSALVAAFTTQLYLIRNRQFALYFWYLVVLLSLSYGELVMVRYFGVVVSTEMHFFLWLEFIAFCLNVVLYIVPKSIINWFLLYMFSVFHIVLYSLIITIFRINLFLISLLMARSRASSAQEKARPMADRCFTIADELISFCTRHVVRSRGRPARDYYKRCHPDILRRKYPRELIDAIETDLGSGRFPRAVGAKVGHACPPGHTAGAAAGPTTAQRTYARSGPVRSRRDRAQRTRQARVQPTSDLGAFREATPLAAGVAPRSGHRWFVLAAVITGLALLGAMVWLMALRRKQSALLDELDEAVALVPHPDQPARRARPYRILYRRRRAPVPPPHARLLTWPVALPTVPEYVEARHGVSLPNRPGRALFNIDNWGNVRPNPAPHTAMGTIRPDLRVRQPGVPDPLMTTGWTLLIAAARRSFGDASNWTPEAKGHLTRGLPQLSKIGPMEMLPVLSFLLACRPHLPLEDAEFQGRVQQDLAVCGYTANELVRFDANDARLYTVTYLAPPVVKPLDIVVMGAAASGKTTTYMQLILEFKSVLIIAISNELLDDLQTRIDRTGHPMCVVSTPHRPLLDGVEPESYDLVIIDEVFALARPLCFRLAALGRQCIGVGDPTQITDLGLQGAPMPFHLGCGQLGLIADFSFTMPHDVASFLITCGRLPVDFITLSPVAHSIHLTTLADTPPNLEFRALARQCGPTIHTFQGQRCHTIHIHVCELDSVLWQFSGAGGHGTTALTRHTDQLYLNLTPILREQLDNMLAYYRGAL